MRQINQALEALKSGQAKAFTPTGERVLVVTGNAIVLRTFQERAEKTHQAILAVRIGGQVIGNSSALNVPGRSGVVTEEQLELSQLVPMIPFNVMREAKLNLETFKEIASGPEETIYRAESENYISKARFEALKNDSAIKDIVAETAGYKEDGFKVTYKRAQHFAGARLFEVGGRRFILDVDRRELEHGIINPFLVELQNTSVDTIETAYQSLKPESIVNAESNGVKVLRQGEWFFTPVQDEFTLKRVQVAMEERRKVGVKENGASWADSWALRGVLRAGNNRPNNVEKYIELDGVHYVSGVVSHSGREHADLDLRSIHVAVPNTSITSWTISGDLD